MDTYNKYKSYTCCDCSMPPCLSTPPKDTLPTSTVRIFGLPKLGWWRVGQLTCNGGAKHLDHLQPNNNEGTTKTLGLILEGSMARIYLHLLDIKYVGKHKINGSYGKFTFFPKKTGGLEFWGDVILFIFEVIFRWFCRNKNPGCTVSLYYGGDLNPPVNTGIFPPKNTGET